MNIFRSALLALAAVSALSPAAFAHEDHDKPEFSYTFPDSVKAHPALAAQLEKRKAEIKTEFDKDLADASEDSKLNNYQYQTDWKVDSETPDFLVLLSSNYTYSGGAHGMFWSSAILWDKKQGKEVKFLDLFADPEKAKAEIMLGYCAMLDAERLVLRGEPTPKDDIFGECVDPFEFGIVYPVKLKDSSYLRIAFTLPPYSAGPYVEGEYEFDTAAPDRITSLLKPEYKALFQSYM